MKKMTLFAISMLASISTAWAQAPTASAPAKVPVTVKSFVRAESDNYFKGTVDKGAFGKLVHTRNIAAIDEQPIVRMNRDTLYSGGVFDLDAGPVTFTMPDTRKRFMSMLVISQDHYVVDVAYGPGRFTYDKAKAGTRYVYVIIRTLVNPEDAADIRAANALQDQIKVQQASTGKFEIPAWDLEQLAKVRQSVKDLGLYIGSGGAMAMFGSKKSVDPIEHLIGAAVGWGGNPRQAAVYMGYQPPQHDGTVPHSLTLKDVPADGFWSVSLYNAQGFFEKNSLNAYSINNFTAKPEPDGSVKIQFGSCTATTPNCLPIMAGWNYNLRLYKPKANVISGSWKPPLAQPIK